MKNHKVKLASVTIEQGDQRWDNALGLKAMMRVPLTLKPFAITHFPGGEPGKPLLKDTSRWLIILHKSILGGSQLIRACPPIKRTPEAGMCKYCAEYGNGTKWYLNPQNYRDELYRAEGHENTVRMLGGVQKNSFEVGAMAQVDIMIPDTNYSDILSMALENMTAHGGQIVPLEDALKIIDLCQEPFVLMHCACRRYFGRSDVLRCLFFWPVASTAIKERPWEKDTRLLTREEAKEFEKECDKTGFLHSIWHAGVNSDGIPAIVMCHCTSTDCIPTKFRVSYGILNSQRKGEYVCSVDPEECKHGCKDVPLCMKRCNFGAMRYNPVDRVLYIDPQACFGCGLCRAACPQGAINLMDRSAFPALVDSW